MGISILAGHSEGHKYNSDYEHAIMYCNTSEWAFGPVFNASKNKSAEEIAIGFLKWHDAKYGDPRGVSSHVLGGRHIEYLKHIGELSR